MDRIPKEHKVSKFGMVDSFPQRYLWNGHAIKEICLCARSQCLRLGRESSSVYFEILIITGYT